MYNIEIGSEVIIKVNHKYVTGIVISLKDGNCCVRTDKDGIIFTTCDMVVLIED